MQKYHLNSEIPIAKTNFFSKPQFWCFTTYFAEGFPYTLIRMVSSIFFRTMNVSLETIGLTSLYSLPWILKFLWAPFMDYYWTKRNWMLSVQSVLALLFIVTAFFVPFNWGISTIGILFFIGAILAATHDTAIDGFYLIALSKDEQARFVGYRVMAYRIAMMAGTGGVVTIGTTIGWHYAFISAGVLLGGLFFFHLFFLPKTEVAVNPLMLLVKNFLKLRLLAGSALFAIAVVGLRHFVNSEYYADFKIRYAFFKDFGFAAWISIFLFSGIVMIGLFKNRIKSKIKQRSDSVFVKAFLSFIDRDGGGILLMFIILLRAGEFLLSTMSSAFMVDLGIKVHIGWITAGVGLPASIAGALLGGWLISKFSLKKMMLPFILAQNLTNLLYMAIALIFSPLIIQNTNNAVSLPIGLANLISVAAVHGFDQFSGGLGTSVLMTFLMRICIGEFKAAHYAIGSGLMSLSGLFTGIISGILAQSLGYGYFFGLSFIVAIPGMILAFPALKVVQVSE